MSDTVPIIVSFGVGSVFLLAAVILLPQPISQPTSYIPFDNPAYGYPCRNVIINAESNGTFYTCPIQPNSFTKVFDLPVPVYKQVKCVSTYGCSHAYNYEEIIPSDLLTPQQKQIVIDKVMDLNETKQNHGWKLDSFDIQPSEDRWRANVQIFLPGIARIPPSSGCGWYGSVTIDLETLNVLNADNIPSRSNITC